MSRRDVHSEIDALFSGDHKSDRVANGGGFAPELFPNHPKNVAAANARAPSEPSYSSPYEQLRQLLLSSVNARAQRHELATTLKLLSDTLIVIGRSRRVRYRTIMAVNMFKNAGAASLSEKEQEAAKTGLFAKDFPYDKEILDLLVNLVIRIRGIVGMKNLNEAAALTWTAVAGDPDKCPDEPCLTSGRTKKAEVSPCEYLALSDEARLQMSRTEQRLKLSASFSAAAMESQSHKYDYVPEELNWPAAARIKEFSGETVIPEDERDDTEPCSSSYGMNGTSDDGKVKLSELVSTVEMNFPETSQTILKSLLELICSEKTDEDIQGELCDLFGYDNVELVIRVLESRGRLIGELDDAKTNKNRISAIAPQKLVSLKGQPSYCQQVIVQAKNEAEMRKESRKEQKRMKREFTRIEHAFGESHKLEMELAMREQQKQRELEMQALRWEPAIRSAPQTKEAYPFVFDAASQSPTVAINFNSEKFALPEGTERLTTRSTISVKVPPPQRDSVKDIQHIYIRDMDEIGQAGFKGFEKLNVIQSLVFEQAYKTRENLLICAPTGAGKTNIAMLTILNCIHDHVGANGQIQKDDFKVIYIAPMKALAAEMAESFGKRLAPLGLQVRELTGDTQLSKKEIAETQMLILTPEKWDVVTRKAGDNSLSGLVRLLIIDEVHLLQDGRGPVIETIVARTLRQVEMSQSGIRIVGLSATLPNYIDVAHFLRVNPRKGLFFFDGRFRPVPLTQKFIGVKEPRGVKRNELKQEMDIVCFEEVVDYVKRGHQVLVFVHARNATTQLAQFFMTYAANKGESQVFIPPAAKSAGYINTRKAMNTVRNHQLATLFGVGLGCHHAGLMRHDRNLMEKAFAAGHISVLFTTATLAWGVNLPAHAVVIRGTDVFDAQAGAFADLGVLDVQQIFGRAGRPQFENEGHGVIITWESKLSIYLRMLVMQIPIESQFFKNIHDNLNAEIALGTVTNIDEAVEWLSYTYYMLRAKRNPLNYGMPWDILNRDPDLSVRLKAQLTEAAIELDKNKMIRFDSLNGFLSSTDLGRISSNFYVKFDTVVMMNVQEGQPVIFNENMRDDHILGLIGQSKEFVQLKVREEETEDLCDLRSMGCRVPMRPDSLALTEGKVNCMLQGYISRCNIRSFSLASEMYYIEQNASRLARAYFEVALKHGWAQTTARMLTMAKGIEKRVWPNQNPLRQLVPDFIRLDWVEKIECKRLTENRLLELTPKDLHNMLSADGQKVYDALRMLPRMAVEARLKPITYTIVQVEAVLTPAFEWNDRLLGKTGSQSFFVLLENLEENMIVHHERLHVNKKKVQQREETRVVFTIPVREETRHGTFQLRVASEYFMSEDSTVALSLLNCKLPPQGAAHTTLLPLDPLPVSILRNDKFQSIYSFEHFNPIQTQVFHTLYHTDENVLLGAPTGSGKTCVAELAIFRMLNAHPGKKCVYIAPMKALVRERVADWRQKFEMKMGHRVLELSGDFTPDAAALNTAPLLISTPEKWDGITRSWATREYVRNVGLIIIDEIHLLGVDRGNVLEAIVTRLKLLTRRSCLRSEPARLIGLSTALANAGDVAAWLGIKESGLFNFKPSVRPVPVNVHIKGFPGQHYCPRMALMNKPAFQSILTYSPHKPTIVFVASRRQTRLTAMAFISLLVSQPDPKQWLHCDIRELEEYVHQVRDENLKLTLPFGIGLHHAGLAATERALVEHLFTAKKIQVLIATATLAWGINMPAHLVIVKGTEYFDAKENKYIDFPVTDVLQMMGRAGRPQFDTSAVAVIYVQDSKKEFYKRFLYEPFPVESSLLPALANHVNAEINAGTIDSRQGIMEYIAGTYLYRRLFANPNFYGLDDLSEENLTGFLSTIVNDVVNELLTSKCIVVEEEEGNLRSSAFGRLASVYYLDHTTIRQLTTTMHDEATIEEMLTWLTGVPEYAEIPVRHNEDEINARMARGMRVRLGGRDMLSPHTKAHLLFQAHFSRMDLQTDYRTDQRSVLDQCIRVIQAMRELCCLRGWLHSALSSVILAQMCHSARWHDDQPLGVFQHITAAEADVLAPSSSIPQLQATFGIEKAKSIGDVIKRNRKCVLERTTMEEKQADELLTALSRFPILGLVGSRLMNVDAVLTSDPMRATPISVAHNTPVTLRVQFETTGPFKFSPEASLPRWPKEKSAGWQLLLGEKRENRLLAAQSLPPVVGRARATIHFVTPDRTGAVELSLFVMSDCYLGIDQEYSLVLKLD